MLQDSTSQNRDRCANSNSVILVVDDEPIARDLIETVLLREGINVILAATGQQAIELCREATDQLDAIILDLGLPDISGLDVYQAVSEMKPGIKTVLTSGYPPNDAVEKLSELPTVQFVAKPFDLDTLTKQVVDLTNQYNSPSLRTITQARVIHKNNMARSRRSEFRSSVTGHA
jgi:DNA-binding NtrC family response regulator